MMSVFGVLAQEHIALQDKYHGCLGCGDSSLVRSVGLKVKRESPAQVPVSRPVRRPSSGGGFERPGPNPHPSNWRDQHGALLGEGGAIGPMGFKEPKAPRR